MYKLNLIDSIVNRLVENNKRDVDTIISLVAIIIIDTFPALAKSVF